MNFHSAFRARLIGGGLLALAASSMTGCSTWHLAKPTASDIKPSALSHTESGTPAMSPEDRETTAQFCQLAAEEFAAAGKTVEAIAMFAQAGQYDPALADSNAHRLAVLHAEAGNAQSARREFAKALRYQPRNANLRSDYGFFLLKQGDLEPAREQLQDALNLDPQNARASMNLGLVSAQLGDVQTAESQFESIVGPTAARHNVVTISKRSDEPARAHIANPVAGVLR